MRAYINYGNIGRLLYFSETNSEDGEEHDEWEVLGDADIWCPIQREVHGGLGRMELKPWQQWTDFTNTPGKVPEYSRKLKPPASL